jgi:indole-3-glycerol phosphate synthase
MGFLTELTSELRRRLEVRPLDDSTLLARAVSMPPPRDFGEALRSGDPAVIAEIKRASPSSGTIEEGADPVLVARAYETGGAAAVSVLTEPFHFHGSLLDLHAVHDSVGLPVLRKDFLVHPSQVIESRANGADAVLLITACLSDPELEAMLSCAADLGMGCLVEAHTEEDLDRALSSGARIVGVNARDLESLVVDGARARRLLSKVGPERIAVMESGISDRYDVDRARAAGANAVLVGEALMRSADPAAKLRELRGQEVRS